MKSLYEYQKESYKQLISNMVILSSMEVLSHYDAVGKVMEQLVSGGWAW